jgi:hypothetical protein
MICMFSQKSPLVAQISRFGTQRAIRDLLDGSRSARCMLVAGARTMRVRRHEIARIRVSADGALLAAVVSLKG